MLVLLGLKLEICAASKGHHHRRFNVIFYLSFGEQSQNRVVNPLQPRPLSYGQKLSRATRLSELPWTSQHFIHFLTKRGEPFT